MTSWSHGAMTELCARLRMACEALSRDAGDAITPDDIRLDDLSPWERDRLMREAVPDVWTVLQGGCSRPASPPPVVASPTRAATPRPPLSKNEA